MSTPDPKVYLVTGSSRGLGRDIVLAALEAGNQVVATARRPEQLSDLVDRFGASVRAIELDVTDPGSADRAVQAALDAFGRLDVVVNNAGYADLASVEDVTPEAFRAQIETNLMGVVNVTKSALPVLRTQGSGHIIQISSVGGRMSTPGLSAYQAAKWAVGGFSLVLAKEVAPLGIHVSVLEPGGMSTDWAGSSMTVPPISEPYRDTVGAMAAMHNTESLAASDPAKVAAVVLQIVAMQAPPVRLLLGPEAFQYATAEARRQLAEDERWEALSNSTAHDDATPEQLDPLGTGR
jgi:NAD(P)-dependent dehydrogenase (short-subunit alcohol dehydrogenase family)